jgi:PAS domain S-box-containing protein
MKRLSTPVTVLALAVPGAALASYPILTSVGRTTRIGDSADLSLLIAGIFAIAVGATMWAGTAIWTARARRRQHAHDQALHDILDRFPQAVILTDARGAITAMNRAAESLTGWVEGSAISLPIGAVFQLVDLRTHQIVVNPVVKALHKDVVVGPSHDTLLLTKEGQERQIRDTASPIHDRRGRLVGCALVGCDLNAPVTSGRRVPIHVPIHETRH